MYLFKNKRERVAVYIDGSNFYNYLKDKEINFPRGLKFNLNVFVNFLVGDKRECISKRYYTGIFSNIDGSRKSSELVKGQQKFLSEIEKEGFTIKGGRIIKHSDGTFKEKGTDVKIAADLIIGAIDNLYDTAILVSSDTDLIPAIKYIKYKGKKLEYVGFSHDPSFAMLKCADLSVLLLPRDIEKFKEKTLLT